MLLPSIKIETCAAKKDIRYYLNGVYFDVDRGTLTASDGHLFLRINHEPEPGDVTCIIPTEAFSAARKLCTKKGPSVFIRTETVEGEPARVIVTNGITESRFSAIDGKYPDVDRVIPTDPVAMSIGLDAKLLETMQSAVCVAGSTGYPSVRLDIVDGSTGYRVGFSDPAVDVAVLMPCRIR